MGEPIVARIDLKGRHFEAYVYPDKAYSFLEGKNVSLEEILAVEKIFRDAKKGIEAPHKDLTEAFGTDDPYEVCKRMLTEGRVPFTTEYVRKLQERKRNWIVNFLYKNFVDPRTSLPHPVIRIERAMKEVKVRIDPFRRPEDQVRRVVEELRTYLPLKGGVTTVVVKAPLAMWGKIKALLSGQGKILREDPTEDGLQVVIEAQIPVRSQLIVLDRVGKMGGSVDIVEG